MAGHLYRSRDDRMLAGVAGGLAEMWDADPSLVRIVWALLVVLTGGIALVVYVVMALVVPEEPDGWPVGAPAASAPPNASGSPPATTFSSPPPNAFSTPPPPDWRAQRAAERDDRRAARAARRANRGSDGRSASIVVGAILVLVGFGFLVREYLPSFDWDVLWPFALVALGVIVILAALRPGDRGGGPGRS